MSPRAHEGHEVGKNSNFEIRNVFLRTENISDSEIPPAKARRAPSSDNYFLCGPFDGAQDMLCVFAGDIPILLVAASPCWALRDLPW
jgi:hypothetical protein